MALTEEDRNEIAQVMARALEEWTIAQEKNGHACLYHRDPNAAEDISHFWGMVKDSGGGGPDGVGKGIEVMRENHKNMSRIQAVSSKLGMWMLIFFFAAITTGILAIFWDGIRHAITGTPK